MTFIGIATEGLGHFTLGLCVFFRSDPACEQGPTEGECQFRPHAPREKKRLLPLQAFVLYAICVSKKKSASGLTIEFIATCSERTRWPRCLTYSYAACSRSRSG